MVFVADTHLTSKFVWENSLAFRPAQCLNGSGLVNATVALNTRSHGLASPFTVIILRISRSSYQDAHILTRRLVQSAKGRLILQLESPAFEWWNCLLALCQHKCVGGVLQVSRPQCAPTERADAVKWALDSENVSGGPDRLCFLNDIAAEAGICC